MAGWELAAIAGLGALVLVLGLALLMQMRGRGQGEAANAQTLDTLQRTQIEMTGRLSQLAEASNVAQAELGRSVNSRLDELSKRMTESQNNVQLEFAKAMNDRLDALGKRVSDNLTLSAEKTSQTITGLEKRLAVIDEAQKHIANLSGQVVSLQDILANKQARGAFGEIQLNDIVRNALPPSAYAFQVTLGNGKRADCLITLPNPPGAIAIDSKFPLESYRALHDAKEEPARIAAGRAFAAAIQKHVRDIAERYIVPGETAESAIMFLPSEAVYAELHANFAQVVAASHQAHVWIVSPTTLMATLNTVRAILKDAQMREQAGVIQKEVQTLLQDVVRLEKRTENLRRHFGNMEKDVREIETSTGKIIRRAERIEEIQVEEADSLNNPAIASDTATPSETAQPAQGSRTAPLLTGEGPLQTGEGE